MDIRFKSPPLTFISGVQCGRGGEGLTWMKDGTNFLRAFLIHFPPFFCFSKRRTRRSQFDGPVKLYLYIIELSSRKAKVT